MEHVTETAFTNTEDKFLIQQFKDGNMDAFDMLYRRHLPVVYNWVRFLIPSDDVEDVAQEIFIAVFKSLPRFRGQSQFKTWLRPLANYKIAEFYRMRLPDLARSLILKQFQNGARESLKTILAETGIRTRQLAIETIEFPFDLTLELAEELDLSICFDTGHVLVGFSGPVDLFDALERCLPRLGEVHLHDGPWQGPERRIGYGNDHQPLGKGDLDVARFLDRLLTAGFHGPLVFELQVEEALASLDVIRSVRPNVLPSSP